MESRLDSAIQCSKEQLFTVYDRHVRLLLHACHQSTAPLSNGIVHDILVKPLSLQLTTCSYNSSTNPIFSSLHHSSYFYQETFSASIFLHILLSGKDLIAYRSSVLSTIIYWNNVISDITGK